MGQASPQPNTGNSRMPAYPPRFWMALAVTAVATGIAGGLLMKLLAAMEELAWSAGPGNFLQGVEHTSPLHRVIILVLAGFIAGGGMWIIGRASKESGGDVSAAIWFRSGKLAAVQSLARAVLSIVIVGMGTSLGREAAPKEAGAAFASKLSEWLNLSAAQRRLLVACGAGAGMAAVYNVPLGGALFGLEVFLGSLAIPLVVPALLTSYLATSVSWLLLPNRPTYHIPTYPISSNAMLWAILAGPLFGLASVLYVRVIAWAETHKPKPAGRFLSPIVIFFVVGVIAIQFPELLGNGKDSVQQAFTGEITAGMAGVLAVLKPILTAACVLSGAPGGLFTPTTMCGALIGTFLGRLFAPILPGVAPSVCAILGAGGVLAASMDAPLAAITLLLGLTGHLENLLPLVIFIAAGAVLTKRIFESRSIYSGRIRIRNRPSSKSAKSDRRISDDYVTVLSATSYADVLECLLTMPAGHPRLFVVDEEGRLLGAISRDLPAGLHSRAIDPPLETTTASDLSAPVDSVLLSAETLDMGKNGRSGSVVPVVTGESVLVGVIRS